MLRNNLLWYSKAESAKTVDSIHEKVILQVRSNQKPEDYVDFPNGTREGPIHRRYRGAERLQRLKDLKSKWDPSGVFSQQFL